MSGTYQMLAGLVLSIMVLSIGCGFAEAQDNAAKDRAKRIIELLQQEKFDEVTKEFNAQVAAALSPKQLGDAWAGIRAQAGDFKSIIDQQVTAQAGNTVVVSGCQFEKANLNAILVFDGDNKISGLRFVPRPAGAEQPPALASTSRYKEEAVTVGSGEWALPATLTMPLDQGPFPAVVLVHGSGPNDRDETVGANKPFRDLAWGLADRGIAVLRYEKRTRQYGARLAGIPNFTVREETVDDALEALKTVRAHDRIDGARVFVIGHSLGGMLAPRIGSGDSRIAGLIIMAGSTRPLEELIVEQTKYIASLSPNVPAPTDPVADLKRLAPDSYWKDLDSYKPASVAASLKMPMLILQGERDYQVTLSDLKGWRDALQGRSNVQITSYPDLNHLFMTGTGKSTPSEYTIPGKVSPAVIDAIANWIKQAH